MRERLPIPGVGLLVEFLEAAGGHKRSLELEFLASTASSLTYLDWDAVSNGDGISFRIPATLVAKFGEVLTQTAKVGVRFDFWHFDLFLIHELLHTYQGMERGKHRGYQDRAPQLLRTLDYEADALAVIALYALVIIAPKHFLIRFNFAKQEAHKDAHWSVNLIVNGLAVIAQAMGSNVGHLGTLASIIHAQLWHLSVFTASMVDTTNAGRNPTLSLEIASGRRFPLAKVERTFAWYLQYYRVRFYRRDGCLADLGLLREPVVEFRNLRAAVAIDSNWLKAGWPSAEAEYINAQGVLSFQDMTTEPAIILAVQGLRGTTRILRWHSPTDHGGIYVKLFKALFNSRFAQAEPFFIELFRLNPWLMGLDDDPVRNAAPSVDDIDAALDKKQDRSSVDIVNISDRGTRRSLLADLARLA